MNTVEIVRIVVGIVFILFGLGVYAYDKTHNMKYSEYRYSPLSWLLCTGIGVYTMSYTVKIGILCGVVTLILWIIKKITISNLIKKREV